jgi:hypothetical protein
MNKESKAQLEVWEWKDKAAQKWLEIPESERLNYINTKTTAVIAGLKIRRATLKPVLK